MQMRGISFLLFCSKESYEYFHFKTDNGRLQCRPPQIWNVRFEHNNKARTKSQLGMIYFFKSDSSFSLKLTVSIVGLLIPLFLHLPFNLFMNLSYAGALY